jgi:hypothetical protein
VSHSFVNRGLVFFSLGEPFENRFWAIFDNVVHGGLVEMIVDQLSLANSPNRNFMKSLMIIHCLLDYIPSLPWAHFNQYCSHNNLFFHCFSYMFSFCFVSLSLSFSLGLSLPLFFLCSIYIMYQSFSKLHVHCNCR